MKEISPRFLMLMAATTIHVVAVGCDSEPYASAVPGGVCLLLSLAAICYPILITFPTTKPRLFVLSGGARVCWGRHG